MIWLVVIAAGLTLLAHTAPFPFLLDAANARHVMWRAPARPGAPTVYLTFDDGPNPTATPLILDELRREGAVATFFLIDRHLDEATAPIVRRMFEDGHGVALHSHTRALITLTAPQMAAWLERTAARVEQLTGRRPCRAFRPHAGWRSAAMLAGLAQARYQLVGWGWNAWDWNWFRRRTAPSVVGRIARRASDGLIVVIHDGHHEDPRADRQYAVDAVRRLVPLLRSRGFALGSVCQVLPEAAP